MKVITMVLLFILLQAGSFKSTRINAEEVITKEEALSLLYEWRDAYLNRDYSPLYDIMHDNWLYAGSSHGKTTDKLAAIKGFKEANFDYSKITYDNLDVKTFGNIAIVRGTEILVLVGHSDKKETSVHLRFTDVYEKKNGKVTAISTHTSPIE